MSAVVMALKAILTWLIPGQSYIESLLIVVICGFAGDCLPFIRINKWTCFTYSR